MANLTPSLPEARATLALPESATRAQVVAAFRRLARAVHPDVSDVPDAALRFAALVAAYQVALGEAQAPPDVDATRPADAGGAHAGTPVSARPTPGRPHHVGAAGGGTVVWEAGRVVLVVGPVTVGPRSVGNH